MDDAQYHVCHDDSGNKFNRRDFDEYNGWKLRQLPHGHVVLSPIHHLGSLENWPNFYDRIYTNIIRTWE